MRRGTAHQENCDFSNFYRQKSGEFVWKWIGRVWDNTVKNIKLDQDEYMDIGPLNNESELKDAAQEVREGTISGWLIGWLDEW